MKKLFLLFLFVSQKNYSMVNSDNHSIFDLCKNVAMFAWQGLASIDIDEAPPQEEQSNRDQIYIDPIFPVNETKSVAQQAITKRDIEELFKKAKSQAEERRKKEKQDALQKFCEKIKLIRRKRNAYILNNQTAINNYKIQKTKTKKQLAD